VSNENGPDNDLDFFISGLLIAVTAVVLGIFCYVILNFSPWLTGLALFSLFAAKFIKDHRPK
jgi:hypothetical protein